MCECTSKAGENETGGNSEHVHVGSLTALCVCVRPCAYACMCVILYNT